MNTPDNTPITLAELRDILSDARKFIRVPETLHPNTKTCAYNAVLGIILARVSCVVWEGELVGRDRTEILHDARALAAKIAPEESDSWLAAWKAHEGRCAEAMQIARDLSIQWSMPTWDLRV